jgi:hypothetical protein
LSIVSTVRDRVTNTAPEAAASGAFAVITALQDLHPARQVLGLAAALKVTAEVLEIDPRELLSIVGRMQDDCHFRNEDTFSAVAAYVAGEIKQRFT